MKTLDRKIWIRQLISSLKPILFSGLLTLLLPAKTLSQSTEDGLKSALIDSSIVLVELRIENHLLKKKNEFLEKANNGLKEAHEQAIIVKIMEGQSKDEKIAFLEKLYRAAIRSRNWERVVFVTTIILTLVVPR